MLASTCNLLLGTLIVLLAATAVQAAPVKQDQHQRRQGSFTFGFSQQRVASWHGRTNLRRRNAAALMPRQGVDDTQQLYNLDDARYVKIVQALSRLYLHAVSTDRYIVNITIAGQQLQVRSSAERSPLFPADFVARVAFRNSVNRSYSTAEAQVRIS